MIVPGYAIPVVLAILLALLFPASQKIPAEYRNVYRGLQLCTLLGAVVGAKLAELAGDYGWPFAALPASVSWWTSGRSIVGGLLGGFLVAETLKPLLRYPLPPNDHFAKILPFSVAIGRIGCVLGGCCRGIRWDGPFAMHYAGEDFGRFPAPYVEMGFHALCGIAFVSLVRNKLLVGRIFSMYLVLYGAFRMSTEPLRDTPHLLGVFSVYQALAALMMVAGLLAFHLRKGGVDGRSVAA